MTNWTMPFSSDPDERTPRVYGLPEQGGQDPGDDRREPGLAQVWGHRQDGQGLPLHHRQNQRSNILPLPISFETPPKHEEEENVKKESLKLEMLGSIVSHLADHMITSWAIFDMVAILLIM